MKKILLISLLLIILIPIVYSESCNPGFFENNGVCERAKVIETKVTNPNYFIKAVFFLAGFILATYLFWRLKLYKELQKLLKKRKEKPNKKPQ